MLHLIQIVGTSKLIKIDLDEIDEKQVYSEYILIDTKKYCLYDEVEKLLTKDYFEKRGDFNVQIKIIKDVKDITDITLLSKEDIDKIFDRQYSFLNNDDKKIFAVCGCEG